MIANKKGVEYGKFVNLLMYELFLESLFFKEEGFCLEKESRLVVMCPTEILETLTPKRIEVGKRISMPFSDSIKIIEIE